jgi:hypothetical protein
MYKTEHQMGVGADLGHEIRVHASPLRSSEKYDAETSILRGLLQAESVKLDAPVFWFVRYGSSTGRHFQTASLKQC